MEKAVLRYQMTWSIVGAGLTMFLTAVACTSEPITLKQTRFLLLWDAGIVFMQIT